MANNSVGCNAGKTILIDPNAFDGHNSSNNISVANEDLNISVELTTGKKARTILTTDKNGLKLVNSSSNTHDVNISFIEGSEINGQKVLTTRFTDLTTTFDRGTDAENLGITNIDIDFNTSYTPQITINFIDVRGSAIFQNEANIQTTINKYSTFFQLPYPIFQLTVKGYYGMPVSYCLHMVSFNARFNSETGNFEITAKFIGYTYAMLSDMLIGYLKAIPHIEIGRKKYDTLYPGVLTLNELMGKISEINFTANKIKSTDPDQAQLNLLNLKKEQLSIIEENVNNFGRNADIEKGLNRYEYVIISENILPSLEYFFNDYSTNVKTNIGEYNENNLITLNVNDFTDKNKVKFYQLLTLTMLNPASTTPSGTTVTEIEAARAFDISRDQQLQTILGSSSDFTTTRKALYDYVESRKILGPDQPFYVYDFKNVYDIIKQTQDTIISQEERLLESLAITLKTAIQGAIGFVPTIRTIVNVFTTAVEVFLSVLFDISAAAKTDEKRIAQLKKFGGESYDMKSGTYYPWPDYRSGSEKTGYVDTYLGGRNILNNPSDVNELKFIDDFLQGFLKSQAYTEQLNVSLNESLKNWYPVNPLDTRLFTQTYPYKRIQANTVDEVLSLIMVRAMTYMGYTNKNLSPEELKAMANVECEAILLDIVNPSILSSLSTITTDRLMLASYFVNGENKKVIIADGDKSKYDYINFTNGISVIPINNGITGTWPSSVKELSDKEENGDLFLTNYTETSILDNNSKWISKPDDGGIYVKIFEPSIYVTNNEMISPKSTTNVLNLEKLQSRDITDTFASDTGFNQFGGAYGVQEFTQLNYGVTGLESAPFRYMFYQNANFGDKSYNKSNGLGLKRKPHIGTYKGQITPYDIDAFTFNGVTNNVFTVAKNINDVMEYVDGNKATHDSYGQNRLLLTQNTNITYPFINFQIRYNNASDGYGLAPVSLFGSRLYYEQTSNYAKALLFLHALPWNGLITTGQATFFGIGVGDTIFDIPEILNTFSQRAGFVSVPKFWAAFIGGMLWRADFAHPILDSTGRIVDGGSGPLDPILFGDSNGSFIPIPSLGVDSKPTKLEYLTKSEFNQTTPGKDTPTSPMSFGTYEYSKIDTCLLTLPDQAKKEFKRIFFDFVATGNINLISDWDKIRNQLEIFGGTGAQWVSAYASTLASVSNDTLSIISTRNTYNVTNNNTFNFDNYVVFTPLLDGSFENNYFIELKDGTQAVKTITDMMNTEIILANTTYKIWSKSGSSNINPRTDVTVLTSNLKVYLDTIVANLTSNKDALSLNAKNKKREQEIFGTVDENIIKFQLYRTCKNIYDKWIGEAKDDNIIFQCGNRNSLDAELGKKREGLKTSLIDSFRFVTRSFRDIGDELFINPIPVNDFLINNPNSSFYDAITSLLSANNFDFIPLPSYINYGDPNVLETMFKPTSYSEAIANGICGPSFICVYIGQKSKHLDFYGTEYTNDGFDARCDENGNIIGLPTDFSNNVADYENNVAIFAVNYSQQNQSIFKDLTLDQSEFSETAESLKIIDDIAKKGAETNRTLIGQNIYNVYSIRSYKSEVEMMGNAMIQPMMYFQLNNVPMFHGAYLITRVRHSIKPNFMSTHFTGVRISKVETELLKTSTIYMSILDSINASNITQTSVGVLPINVGNSPHISTGSFAPIINTIVENGGTNGAIERNNITMSKIIVPSGIGKYISDTDTLLTEAVGPLNAMLTDWVAWMKANGFVGNNGSYAYINSGFRTFEQQEITKIRKGTNAAEPGHSNHGWGIAIDLQFFKKDGHIINNYVNGRPNVSVGYDLTVNEALVWLLDNSYTYGWIIPKNLRDDSGLEEFWHFEYHGRAAQCILNEDKKIKGRIIDMSKPYNDIVSNPKISQTENAKYSGCKYKNVGKLDGTIGSILPVNKNIIIVTPSNEDIDFYSKILQGVNAIATPENLKFLYAWRQAEGGGAAWNPFNTTKILPITTNYNCNRDLKGKPISVKNYQSKEDGISATVKTLNASYYKKITNGLQNNLGAEIISGFVDELNVWGTGVGVNNVLAGVSLNPPAISITSITKVNC